MPAEIAVAVQAAPFSVSAELAALRVRGAGAEVSFTGVVRADGGLVSMDIEHYPGMTEAAIEAFAQRAAARWDLLACRVVHRHGTLRPGETIMMVATAAAHRAAAFEAAEYLMDYLKSRAPFWKQEVTASGTRWVQAKAEDEDALARWD